MLETPGIKNTTNGQDSVDPVMELVGTWNQLLLSPVEPNGSSAEVEENKPVSQVKAEFSPGEFCCR